mmetsp:Transcript_34735/g.97946  ORF Transcript_34735/g.97946 Transcript_34735/m.97946 type:complete len:205 (-) Transcript_34735:1210-1824(-)
MHAAHPGGHRGDPHLPRQQHELPEARGAEDRGHRDLPAVRLGRARLAHHPGGELGQRLRLLQRLQDVLRHGPRGPHAPARGGAGPERQPAVPGLQERVGELRGRPGPGDVRLGHPDRGPRVHRPRHPGPQGHGRHRGRGDGGGAHGRGSHGGPHGDVQLPAYGSGPRGPHEAAGEGGNREGCEDGRGVHSPWPQVCTEQGGVPC